MTFIEQISEQLRKMLIGKKYTADDLAFFSKGALLPTTIITNVSASLSAVMFPVLSNAQNNLVKALAICRKWIKLFAFCSFPVLVGMVFSANELIIVLMTRKWLFSVPYLQLACAVYAAWIIEMPIRETIKSLGHAKIILRIQLIKTAFALGTLLLVMNYGVLTIAATAAACGLFNISVSSYYGNKYVGYKSSMLFSDIWPQLLLSALMGAVIFLVGLLKFQPFPMLLFKVMTGLLSYIVFSKVTKNEDYQYLEGLLKEMFQGRKGAVH